MPAINVAKRKRAVRIANAINSIEGVPVSKKAKELSMLWANGEITGEQLKASLYTMHKRN